MMLFDDAFSTFRKRFYIIGQLYAVFGMQP
ncbi:Uncharacterised protein [Vibrio cholerae]|nr:Uncharacterised protein [Vibrio cholerae]